MFSMILSAAVIGVEAKAVQVEADVCDGLPMFRSAKTGNS